MKNAQKYIDKVKGSEVIKAEEVKYIQSSSDPSKKHRLVKIDEVWFCECIGFQMRGRCSHVNKILEEEKNETKRNEI